MQVAPYIEIRVDRFGRWRTALAILAGMACAASAAWSWQAMAWYDAPVRTLSVQAVLASALLGLFLCFQEALSKTRGFRLVWDGQCWWHQRIGGGEAVQEAMAGDLAVALDLGNWLLLKYIPLGEKRRTAWLPVECGALEAKWHALRCAVYSPRPTPAGQPPFHAATPELRP